METLENQISDEVETLPVSSISQLRKMEMETDFLTSQLSRMSLTTKTVIVGNPTGKYTVNLKHGHDIGFAINVNWKSNKKKAKKRKRLERLDSLLN